MSVGRWGESSDHEMDVGGLNHRGAGSDGPFVVLAMPSTASVPGVGSLHDPAFFQGDEAFRSLGTHLHLDSPPGTMFGHPLLKMVIAILVVAEDRLQSRQLFRRNQGKQLGRSDAVVDARGGDQHGDEQSQRIDQQMSLPALDFLPAVVASLFPADLGRLRRLTVDARRAGRRFLSRRDAHLASQSVDQPLPRAVVAPLGEVPVRRALGGQIVRQHVPLATAAVDVQNRVDYLTEVDLARTSEAVRSFRRQPRRKQTPLLFRQVRRIRFTRKALEPHGRQLRGTGKESQKPRKNHRFTQCQYSDSLLESGLKQPVIDETGLDKAYDLVVNWNASDTPRQIADKFEKATGLEVNESNRSIQFAVFEER